MKDSTKIISSLIITTIIFSSGFLISNIIIENKINLLNELQSELYSESLGFDTLNELVKGDICNENSTIEINMILTEFGNKISYLESKNIDLISLKNQYYALEIKHYLLINEINEKCGKKYDTILYFYGTEDECKLCSIQGEEITRLKNNSPEKMVYSFDYNSEYLLVRNLINTNSIEITPSIIINKEKYEGFLNYNDLNKFFS